ncbi:hypothetical protein EPI10_019947 [Gossypium australe]|uniref:Uncharacterized protein n=1 Tax=Gossypium australe TaxID=47621 RepID=A0A5B6WE54_9ROSI|nr:hypothetical protein EPI10_019947 [Gossypium australe]
MPGPWHKNDAILAGFLGSAKGSDAPPPWLRRIRRLDAPQKGAFQPLSNPIRKKIENKEEGSGLVVAPFGPSSETQRVSRCPGVGDSPQRRPESKTTMESTEKGGLFWCKGAGEPGVVRPWVLNVLARHVGSGARLLGLGFLFLFTEKFKCFWANWA